MAYITGERNQISLMPSSIEDYVAADDPVRAYDIFVEQLYFSDLGIPLMAEHVGAPDYDPRAMLKLLVYGYSYGIRSSRKLERATHHNLSFIWLVGGLKPDHKTIARFRREHIAALKNVLKQCARLCLKLGLVEGNTLFVDGSKMRANASFKQNWTEERCEKALNGVDRRIEGILAECEAADEAEGYQDSLVRMREDLKDAQALKGKIKEVLSQLRKNSGRSLNTTDPDSQPMKSRQGSIIGYNMQTVVDDQNGLIVHADAVQDKNDRCQFNNQISAAQNNLGVRCNAACGDTGYANTDELKPLHEQGVKVIVPSQEQSQRRPSGPFDKSRFAYDRAKDCYICPQGHELPYRKTEALQQKRVYQVAHPAICRGCVHFGECTTAKQGRSIVRLFEEDLKKELEAQYARPDSQAIYKRRKEKSELPFGHLKHNLGTRSFLLRGLSGVQAEASLLSTAFNLARMITLLGVTGLIKRVGEVRTLKQNPQLLAES